MMPNLQDIPTFIKAHIKDTLIKDRYSLLMAVQRIVSKKHVMSDENLTGLYRRWEESNKIYEARKSRHIKITYPEDLPVSKMRDSIRDAIQKHPVIIVAGATGSGKTTQLPKICLELGRGVTGMIGCTQPRRIAALSVASRLASELNVQLGEEVGSQIRFLSKVKPCTRIKFMTDGILLNEIQHDRDFYSYDTLILDEVHERGLNVDFLLGCVKQTLERRKNLRVIISSATLDVKYFSDFFNQAPIINVEGQTYPVDIIYRSPEEDEEEPDLDKLVLRAVEELDSIQPESDILAFFPGEADIRDATEILTKAHFRNTEILPLYARLSAEEQQAVFQPTSKRKIILATNVAETSLTIPGIRAVIDSGLARIRRVSDKSSLERLQIEKISRASANQRKGRAGRIDCGVCMRLYSEDDFNKRPEFTDPEIRRVSLSSVILTMENLKLGRIDQFPFLNKPESRRIADGYRELYEIGALSEDKHITQSGRKIAALPIEPRYAKMLHIAEKRNVLDAALVIIAGMSIQDPRERPMKSRDQADVSHRKYLHPKSDFLALFNLWKAYRDAEKNLVSKTQIRKFCKTNFLSILRMREWRDIHRQLSELMDVPINLDPTFPDFDDLHISILAGLLGRIGVKTDDGDYQGARDIRFQIWPGSALASNVKKSKKNEPPKKEYGSAWVMCAEIVETSRIFGRCVAEIDPLWIEKLGDHLAKRSYSEPSYDAKSGFVRAKERVTVYGLHVIENRRVHYGTIDPVVSRDVFIREGLVSGNLKSSPNFLIHNLELIDQLQTLEHKSRKRGIVVDDEVVFMFYNNRIPADVHNDRDLLRFVHQAEKENPNILRLTESDLLAQNYSGITPDLFPNELMIENRKYPLTYKFDPVAKDDGVTVTISITDLPSFPVKRLEWLVPGLLGDRIAYLIRGLPRSIRRVFTPIPETVESILKIITPGSYSLTESLAAILLKQTGQKIKPEDWDETVVPNHLLMNIRVHDLSGKLISEDRNFKALSATLKSDSDIAFSALPKNKFEHTGITSWNFGELPHKVTMKTDVGTTTAFPSLVDEGNSVSIRLMNTSEKAQALTRKGLRRLIQLSIPNMMTQIRKNMSIKHTTIAELSSHKWLTEELKEEVIRAALDESFLKLADTLPRDSLQFESMLHRGKPNLNAAATKIYRCVFEWLQLGNLMLHELSMLPNALFQAAYSDMSEQLLHLCASPTLTMMRAEEMQRACVYLKAIQLRKEKLRWNLQKDRIRQEEFLPYWKRYLDASDGKYSGEVFLLLCRYRWLLEEWRIGLFAQELGTSEPVSGKRLSQLWSEFETAKRNN